MKQTVLAPASDEARSELNVVAESLARTPRLQQLLRYLVGRYFDDEADQLTEYNIATEVFGRKKTDFIASEDAIARVETHRLRKRLAAYYETQGKDHALQISIPLGTYVPAFLERRVEAPAAPARMEEPRQPADPLGTAVPALPAAEMPRQSKLPEPPAPPPVVQVESPAGAARWRPLWLMLAVVLVSIAVGVVVLRARTKALSAAQNTGLVSGDASPAAGASGGSAHAPVPGQPAPVALPFRVIAGYRGAPQRDDTGEIWQPDAFFHGGWEHRQPHVFVARTSNPLIYQYARDGDFSYQIPLAPGLYELHLYFMQGSDTAQAEDAENKAIFNVTINGTLMLRNFDIVSDAMGRNTADERVFRDVSPAPDGLLHIDLNTVLGTPSISAIAVLAGTPHTQSPVRLVMQPAPFTDRSGKLWSPDNHFLGGRYLSHNIPETGAESDVLSFERYGHFNYAIPVDTRDTYTVVLHFTELYFGTEQSDLHDTRVFRVMCNGQTLLDDFNIYKEAGDYHMVVRTFHHLKPSAQGKLNIDFEPVSNYATVSAMEVLDESH